MGAIGVSIIGENGKPDRATITRCGWHPIYFGGQEMVHAPLPMEIQGFDDRGYHTGHATWSFAGWSVWIRGQAEKRVVRDIQDARKLLRDNGARSLKESDGRKY